MTKALIAPLRASTNTVDLTVQAIGSRIVTGGFGEGQVLPKEVELASEYSIGRSTLREAVKVLAGKGLVRTARRYGTQVCPRTSWNFLDPDVLAWYASVPANIPDLLLSIIELRHAIEPSIAALAARRATVQEANAIKRHAEGLLSVLPGEPVELDIAFHAALLRATHNILFVALGPTYETLLRAQFRTSWTIMEKTPTYFPDERHLKLAEAVLERDAAAASRIAKEMMRVSRKNVENVSKALGLSRHGPRQSIRSLVALQVG
jgi:DNA-binding FadR family transcriptional regulator